MDQRRMRRIAARLNEGDVAMLAQGVDYGGGQTGGGFTRLLFGTLEAARDLEKTVRLRAPRKRLGEGEIIWICGSWDSIHRQS